MPFTKEEFEAWHKAKRQREWRPTPVYNPRPIATCIHCHRPFDITEGTITEDFAICDICGKD
jgi:hypothetical protein